MTFSLRRISDGAGDSGPMSVLIGIKLTDPNYTKLKENFQARPTVGYGIKVGSIFSRTYDPQDYWMTTEVTEILEDTPARVRFKTLNSEYEWKIF